MLVSIEDFRARFPRPLTETEEVRAATLLVDAEDLIRAEFARRGRNFDYEITGAWLPTAVRRVIVEMVSTVILVGDQAGRKSGSVQAGQVSESWSYGDAGASTWGTVRLTSEHLDILGLSAARSRGNFPPAPRWPEERGW